MYVLRSWRTIWERSLGCFSFQFSLVRQHLVTTIMASWEELVEECSSSDLSRCIYSCLKIMFIARPNVFLYSLFEIQCYRGAFLRWRTCSLKGASTLFSWQWRFVSLSCRQYPHVFYIAYFNVHFILFFYICSLYLLCCVIDDCEHAIDIRKPYVNHSTIIFSANAVIGQNITTIKSYLRVEQRCHCGGPNILPD